MFDITRFELHKQINPADISEIIAFLNLRGDDLLQSGPIKDREDPRWIYRWTTKQSKRTTLIRERKMGRVVAVASMDLTYPWRRGVGIIGYVLSDPDCRGQGLGRSVVVELIRQAREEVDPPLNKIELVSEPHRTAARTLYESLGFRLQQGSDRHYELFLSKNEEHPDAA